MYLSTEIGYDLIRPLWGASAEARVLIGDLAFSVRTWNCCSRVTYTRALGVSLLTEEGAFPEPGGPINIIVGTSEPTLEIYGYSYYSGSSFCVHGVCFVVF